MSGFFIICMLIAMAAVLGVLIVGIVSMLKGGAFNEKYGNRLMQARVVCQGIALAFFALAFLTTSH